MCAGRRCRRCHGLTRVAYSRANAKAQKMTVIAPESRQAQRGSWWVGTAPQDFTAYASIMVVPLEDTKTTYYKFRDNNL